MNYEINEYLHSEMEQKLEELRYMRESDIVIMDWIKKNASNYCVY